MFKQRSHKQNCVPKPKHKKTNKLTKITTTFRKFSRTASPLPPPPTKPATLSRVTTSTYPPTTRTTGPIITPSHQKRSPLFTTSARTFSTAPTPPDLTNEFYKLDLRVSLLDNVRDHPNADSLYIMDCHVGEEVPRQLVSNVKSYMSIADLTNRQQVVLTNLKPVGFRGEKSYAMFLGGNSQDLSQNGLVVPQYTPSMIASNTLPEGSLSQFKPGQRCYLFGESPVEGEVARVNEKAIAKLFGELSTDQEGNLTYLNKSVVFGPVDAPIKVGLGFPNAKLI